MMILLMSNIVAQNLDVDRILESPSFEFNGSFSTQFQYQNSSTTSIPEPFTYLSTLNLNFGSYGFSLPVNLSYSNREYGVNNPFDFNFVQFSPKYKWFAGHFGQISPSFSSYTLNGHLMQGGSISLSPETWWPVKLVYGRLLKATQGDTLQGIGAGYDRWGYGFSTEGNMGSTSIKVAYFGAHDDPTSLENDSIIPLDNQSIDLTLNTTLFDLLTLNINWATSLIIYDQVSTNESQNLLGSLLTDKIHEEYHALKLGVQYSLMGSSVGVQYERVSPNYKTLGGYNFVNDFQDIQLQFSTVLFSVLNIAANAGFRVTDLDRVQSKYEQNYIYGLQLGWNVNEQLNLNLSYNTTQSYQNVRSQFLNLNNAPDQFSLADTTDMQLVNESISSSVSYVIEQTDTRQQNISLNASLQGNKQTQSKSNYTFNTQTSYTLAYPKSGWNYTSSMMLTQQNSEQDNMTLGPNLGIQKTWLENLSSGFNMGYNASWTDGNKKSENLNMNLNSTYSYDKHNLNLAMVQSLSWTPTFSDRQNISFTYSYSF